MIIYLDLVFLLNLFFNFVLLFAVNYLLKRKSKLYRLFLSALIGSCSIFFLFIPLTTISLFLLKVLVSILMIFISFPYKGFKTFVKELSYLYIISIFLGGFFYLINIRFNYSNDSAVFFRHDLSINVIAMILLTPIIVYLYIKEIRSHKTNYNNYQSVEIHFNNKVISLTGYIDTGNRLKDPYKGRSIILLFNKEQLDIKQYIYVPFYSLNNKGIIKCFTVDKVIINNKEYFDLLIGISNEEFHIEGVDCILPNKIKEDLNEKNH